MNKLSVSTVLPILELCHVQRIFQQGEKTLHILQDINLKLYEGEMIALVGPSGSGKSTLLQLAGLLERPSFGDILIQGRSCHLMKDHDRTLTRCVTVGYVYQFHHLLPEFTALENIILPQMIAGVSFLQAQLRAEALLKSLALENRALHRPSRLSGGEQQRIAILRALANNPAIIIADEPTGNLDEETAQKVFQELIHLVKGSQKAALIATHNLELAKKMDRIVSLHKGKLKEGL